MSKGLIIVISGVILFISTLIWIFIDDKNKEKREAEILKKASERKIDINNNSVSIIEDEIVALDETTEALYDSTIALDETEAL